MTRKTTRQKSKKQGDYGDTKDEEEPIEDRWPPGEQPGAQTRAPKGDK
jgi:hypothetical protein